MMSQSENTNPPSTIPSTSEVNANVNVHIDDTHHPSTTPFPSHESKDSSSLPHPSPSSPPPSSLVDPLVHISSPPITPDILEKITEFRFLLQSDPLYQSSLYLRDYCTDTMLHSFLRARSFDLHKAMKLLLSMLLWRLDTLPNFISPQRVENDHKTGKMIVKEKDQWNRPIWVMDSSKDTSKKDHEAMISHLFYILEYTKRRMTDFPSAVDGVTPVEKYLLFINLSSYSMFNSPPMKTSMETLKTLVDRYPEHLGHAVLWQPPMFFQVLWAACKPFLDQKTISKIHFIKGECGVGTKNNEILNEIIGKEWREKCNLRETIKGNQGKEKVNEYYCHEEEFPLLLAEHKKYLLEIQQKYGEDGKLNAKTKAEEHKEEKQQKEEEKKEIEENKEEKSNEKEKEREKPIEIESSNTTNTATSASTTSIAITSA